MPISHIQMIALIQQSKSLNDTMPNMKSWFYILSISFSLSNALAQTAEGKPSGYELMTSKQYGNCIACHDMPGVQGLVSNFAPSLKGVGQKFSAQELTQWVVDARRFNPDTLMPPFGSTHGLNLVRPNRVLLTNEQIALVVSSLQSFR
jgi:sulfur-oxidizing protein SoxX